MTNRTDKLYFYALTEISNDNTDELNSLSTSELLLALDDAGFTTKTFSSSGPSGRVRKRPITERTALWTDPR